MDGNHRSQWDQRGKRLSSSRRTEYRGSPSRDDQDVWNSLSVPGSPAVHRLPPQSPAHHYDTSNYATSTPSDWYRIPDTAELYNPGMEAGGSSAMHHTPMSTFWRSQAQDHQSTGAGGSGHYDLAPESISRMGLTNETPSQGQYTGTFHHQESEPPSIEELSKRNPKFNLFTWQRKLKEKEILDIYKRVGAYWPRAAQTTILARITLLNAKLQKETEWIKPILNNDQNFIEKLAKELVPHGKAKNKQNPTPKMTMEEYLDYTSTKKWRQPQRLVGEEATPDDVGHAKSTWIPVSMDTDSRRKLLLRLSHIWKNNVEYVDARLTRYGPIAVEQAALSILYGDNETAEQAANWLTRSAPFVEQLAIEEQNNLQEQGRSNDWAPDWMNIKQQDALVKRLTKIWNIGESRAQARLSKYGPDVVSECAPLILSNEVSVQRQGARMLYTTHNQLTNKKARRRSRQPADHQEENQFPIFDSSSQHVPFESHQSQQHPYGGQSLQDPYGGHQPQQDPYGGQYGQQSPSGHYYTQYNTYGSYNPHDNVD